MQNVLSTDKNYMRTYSVLTWKPFFGFSQKLSDPGGAVSEGAGVRAGPRGGDVACFG